MYYSETETLTTYKVEGARYTSDGGLYLTNIGGLTKNEKLYAERLQVNFITNKINAKVIDTPIPGYDYLTPVNPPNGYRPWGYIEALAAGMKSIVSYEDNPQTIFDFMGCIKQLVDE